MTRLKDLANAAGVSIRTVTRALRDAPDVNAETRERVRAFAEKMHYRPHLAARGLKIQKSFSVGMIAGSLDELTAEKVNAFEISLRDAGYALELRFSTRSTHELEKDLRSLESLLDRRPAGVALLRCDQRFTDVLLKSGVPFVMLDPGPNVRFDAVLIDRTEGVREAVNYILRKGRERVAYLGPPSDVGGRRKGYRSALAKWPKPLQPLYLKTSADKKASKNQFDFGQAGADTVLGLDQTVRPDAVVCYTDHVALGLLHGLHERNVRVPEDIAVIGFDDRSAAALSYPRLTTIAQPNEAVGREAARMLLEKIAATEADPPEEKRIPRIVVPTRLVIRESA